MIVLKKTETSIWAVEFFFPLEYLLCDLVELTGALRKEQVKEMNMETTRTDGRLRGRVLFWRMFDQLVGLCLPPSPSSCWDRR